MREIVSWISIGSLTISSFPREIRVISSKSSTKRDSISTFRRIILDIWHIRWQVRSAQQRSSRHHHGSERRAQLVRKHPKESFACVARFDFALASRIFAERLFERLLPSRAFV